MLTPAICSEGYAALRCAISVSIGSTCAPGVTYDDAGFDARSMSFSNTSALPDTEMTMRKRPAASPTH